MFKIELTRKQLTELIQHVSGLPVTNDIKMLTYLQTLFPERIQEITEEKKTVLVCLGTEFKVVGVTFENRQELLKKMSAGDKLSIKHQPDNPHDKFAVAVFIESGEQVGFLCKEEASLLYDALDGLAGRVAIVGGYESNPTMGLRFTFIRQQDADSKLNIQGVMEAIEGHSPEEQQMAQNELELVLRDTMPSAPKKPRKTRKKEKDINETTLFENPEPIVQSSLPPVQEIKPKEQSNNVEEDTVF